VTAPAPATRSVVVEREIPHPPEKIWRALTRPELMAEWLMHNDFQPVVGHRFTLSGNWGGTLACEVLALDRHRSLSYSWNHAHADPAYALESTVTFTLTPTPAGTLLRVEQQGFRPGQKQAFGGASAGWRDKLARLERLLDAGGTAPTPIPETEQ